MQQRREVGRQRRWVDGDRGGGEVVGVFFFNYFRGGFGVFQSRKRRSEK